MNSHGNLLDDKMIEVVVLELEKEYELDILEDMTDEDSVSSP